MFRRKGMGTRPDTTVFTCTYEAAQFVKNENMMLKVEHVDFTLLPSIIISALFKTRKTFYINCYFYNFHCMVKHIRKMALTLE